VALPSSEGVVVAKYSRTFSHAAAHHVVHAERIEEVD
jgi:hypothetical protein